jgi:hypothetical protein
MGCFCFMRVTSWLTVSGLFCLTVWIMCWSNSFSEELLVKDWVPRWFACLLFCCCGLMCFVLGMDVLCACGFGYVVRKGRADLSGQTEKFLSGQFAEVGAGLFLTTAMSTL